MKPLYAAIAMMVSPLALGAAHAECTVVNQDLEQRIADNRELRAAYEANLVRDMRQLRDAALLLSRYGEEEACETVAAVIQDTLQRKGAGRTGQQPGAQLQSSGQSAAKQNNQTAAKDKPETSTENQAAQLEKQNDKSADDKQAMKSDAPQRADDSQNQAAVDSNKPRPAQAQQQEQQSEHPQSQEQASRDTAPETTGTVRQPGYGQREAGDQSRDMTDEEKAAARLAAAVPLSEVSGGLRSEEIVGTDVRGPDDEQIGEIQDVIVGTGQQGSFAIVGVGGFLGLGEEQIAIPFSEILISSEGDVFYVALTEEQLEDAPRFERDSDWINNATWRERVTRYFETAKARPAGQTSKE